MPINHILDLAYDMTRWDLDSTAEWLHLWASREFPDDLADEIADIAHTYMKLSSKKKFELIIPATFSIYNYLEAETILDQWNSLAEKAQNIYDRLPDSSKPGFFEILLHPSLSGAGYYDLQISAARNVVYTGQGRNSANYWAQRVLDKFRQDHELSARYNKLWPHLMDQTHIGYSYW